MAIVDCVFMLASGHGNILITGAGIPFVFVGQVFCSLFSVALLGS